MPERRSSAQMQLAEQQQDLPLPNEGGTGRVDAMVAELRRSLPAEIIQRLDDGRVVAGEIGQAHPDVATDPVGAGEFLVTFSTGMFQFVEAVIAAFSYTIVSGDRPRLNTLFDAAVEALRSNLQVYRSQTNASWDQLTAPAFASNDLAGEGQVRDWMNALISLTSQFMLAHEFGHVAIGLRLADSKPATEETDADRLGLNYSLRAAIEAQQQTGIAVCAAGFAIRIYVSLERFGIRFSSSYPPMNERLALLNDALLELLGSQQRADEVSRLMVAMLDAMDHLDDIIDPSGHETPLTVARLRVGIIARLYELARGYMRVEAFVAEMRALRARCSADDFTKGFTAVCDYYWDWADTVGMFVRDLSERSTYDHSWLIANSRALRDAVRHFSESERAVLPVRYRLEI
jgi:hypothetical protein